MFSFKLFTSKTFWAALTGAVTAVTQLDFSHGLPIAQLLLVLAAFVTALGIRDAVSTNAAPNSSAVISGATKTP